MPERVLIAIMSAGGREEYRSLLRSRCLRKLPHWCQYVFFVGRNVPPDAGLGDVISVDAGDGYLDLSAKVLKFFQRAFNEYDFSYLLKCDDNTLVFPSQLERILRDVPGYAGNVVTPWWFNRSWHYQKLRKDEVFRLYDVPYEAPYAQGGSGYLLSRDHLAKVVKAAQDIDPLREFYEDKMVGDCLSRAGVLPMQRKGDFVIRGHWHPAHVPLTLKCSSVQEMKRYSRVVSAPPALRQIFALARRANRRVKQILMNRGVIPNPDARGEGGFIVCRKGRFLAVNIPKNGSRSILTAVYEKDIGGKLPADIYAFFGFKFDGKYRIPIAAGSSEEFREFTKFAVWRDPVERLLSLYRDKVATLVSEKAQSYFLMRGIVGGSFDDFLLFVEDELRRPPIETDEHIRRQIDFFKPSDVDWIVPIDHLSLFMEKELAVTAKKKTDVRRNVNIPELTGEQISRIKRIYAEDTYIFHETKIYNGKHDESHVLSRSTRG